MIDPLLEIGPHVTVIPVVHGSGDFAWEVRRLMLKHSFDCLAVPLPPSFQQFVETAILDLPVPSVVVQRDLAQDYSTIGLPRQPMRTGSQIRKIWAPVLSQSIRVSL